MDIFEEKCKVIDRAVKHLITGEDIFSDNNNKQPMRVTKVINSAIQLKSLEVDTALLMLAKIVRRNKGISVDRVVQLIRADELGKHLFQIMDTYNWSYHGFMNITDKDLTVLHDLKKYQLPAYDIYTGFYGNHEDSFVVKMKRTNSYDPKKDHKNAMRDMCRKILNLHDRLYNSYMTEEELKEGEELIRSAIFMNSVSLDVLLENLFKNRAEYCYFIEETFKERFIIL